MVGAKSNGEWGMNIRALAYVVAEATNPESWAAFGERVVGLQAVKLWGGHLALKADERLGRIFIEPGTQDRYAVTGWEVANASEFAAALADLERAGVAVEVVEGEQAHNRGFMTLARFRDPAGNRHELGWGYRSDFSRFISPVGVRGFVMGKLGMGHVVLPAPNFDEMQAFCSDVLGLGLADVLVHRPAGPDGPSQRIHFLHCGNPRHHSLALFEGAVSSGCVHMMLEYAEIDDVGRAIDRVAAEGAKMTATLGRHTNDGVISFYCATPGGFSIELGYGGRLIDWDEHCVFESTSVSLWGHDFSLGF